MKKYVLGIILCITLSSCVSTYQSIQIESLAINDYSFSLKESNVEITMDYDVLTGWSNRRYSEMAKKNNVSLVVISVQNLGQKELLLPKDLLFQTSSGDSIQPLDLGSAMVNLVPPEKKKRQTSGSNVEAPPVFGVIWQGGKAVNETKKVISFVRFSNDMAEHYLQERTLEAGQRTKGFLVLPVKKGTPLKISIR